MVTNVQPQSRARRRISKIRNVSAAAGWTCRVAVVCMVLPRSVVESEVNINHWLRNVNLRLIYLFWSGFSPKRGLVDSFSIAFDFALIQDLLSMEESLYRSY